MLSKLCFFTVFFAFLADLEMRMEDSRGSRCVEVSRLCWRVAGRISETDLMVTCLYADGEEADESERWFH